VASADVSAANAAFWDELCGSHFARQLGIKDNTPEELARFDAAYMAFYPYLPRYLEEMPTGGKVLEIGIGYGTVARILARRTDYHAVDIAPGPVAMARQALTAAGKDPAQALQASALELPFEDGTFDGVTAIGSLHHTGDLARAVSEVRRVLREGGCAVVMVYNAHSWNRAVTTRALHALARAIPGHAEWLHARVFRDANAEGAPAPHTDFVTRAEAKQLFSGFSAVTVRSENANYVGIRGRAILRREWLLPVIGPVAGLDLYITATL
jgi:SAM-dependent methyltransferase